MTSMATAGSRWGVVMSRNAGFSDQVEFCLSSAFTVLSLSEYYMFLLFLQLKDNHLLLFWELGRWGVKANYNC